MTAPDWIDGMVVTLMREGINKHRAREITVGFWEAYCKDDGADAERYRWLRDPQNTYNDAWNFFGPRSTAAEIDAAIDAARGET